MGQRHTGHIPTNPDQSFQLPLWQLYRPLSFESFDERLVFKIAIGAIRNCGAGKFGNRHTIKSGTRLHSGQLAIQHCVLFVGIDIKSVSSELAFCPIEKPSTTFGRVRDEALNR